MADIENGGPAFPGFGRHVEWSEYGGRNVEEREGDAVGMTLRDYFAARAPVDLLLSQICAVDGWGSPAHIAAASYMYADAMLKARKEPQ